MKKLSLDPHSIPSLSFCFLLIRTSPDAHLCDSSKFDMLASHNHHYSLPVQGPTWYDSNQMIRVVSRIIIFLGFPGFLPWRISLTVWIDLSQ